MFPHTQTLRLDCVGLDVQPQPHPPCLGLIGWPLCRWLVACSCHRSPATDVITRPLEAAANIMFRGAPRVSQVFRLQLRGSPISSKPVHQQFAIPFPLNCLKRSLNMRIKASPKRHARAGLLLAPMGKPYSISCF